MKESELANEVHIFLPGKKEGIGFYDRRPEEVEAKFAGEIPEGVFETYNADSSFFRVTRESVERQKGGIKNIEEMYANGTCKITEFEVTLEELETILRQIIEQKQNPKNKRIRIDLRNKLKENEQTTNIKEKVDYSDQEYERKDTNKISLREIMEFSRSNSISKEDLKAVKEQMNRERGDLNKII